MTKIPDVKRYLQDMIIANDGLLVVRDHQPFHPVRDKIVVPREVINGLLTALHIPFDHPSRYQMKKLVGRYYFAVDMDKTIDKVVMLCHHCQMLRSIPPQLNPQATVDPPTTVGSTFAADVLRWCKQYIFLLRDTSSSYTRCMFIDDEHADSLQEAITILTVEAAHKLCGGTTIRVDSAPGFVALKARNTLNERGITLEIGSPKNVNKEPCS